MAIEELLEEYIATWNETDPAERRRRIVRYWHENAWYANALQEYEGHDGIASAMQRNFDKWVANGYRFRSAGTAASHHDTARFAWQMVDPSGQAVVACGTNSSASPTDGFASTPSSPTSSRPLGRSLVCAGRFCSERRLRPVGLLERDDALGCCVAH
jgi:hypothetical protein